VEKYNCSVQLVKVHN